MNDKIKMIIAMLIFGSAGIFAKYINMPSGFLSMSRAVLGAIFIFIVLIIAGKRPDIKAIKSNFLPLFISGIMLGANWICLFEAYNYTAVSTATLCNYMAPVIMIVLSPFLLKEKLFFSKIVCVAVAFVGIFLVADVLSGNAPQNNDTLGIICGLLAAGFYVALVFVNKKIGEIDPMSRAFFQLVSATVLILPYTLIFEKVNVLQIDLSAGLLLLILGFVHTGLAYIFYLNSIGKLQVQVSAMTSYIEPVSAIIFSAVILGERMSGFQALGAVMILSALIVPEVFKFLSKKD